MSLLRDSDAKRLYVAVAICAILVHLGALANRWAWDDVPIIYYNPLLRAPHAIWRAFVSPYWPAEMGGAMYRPFPIASYAVDWRLGSIVWFHAINLVWHAAATVAVAMLARRWAGDPAAWVAGLLFAVHPVHVEAVANVVGRSELMAALFVLLAVYAALVRDEPWWSVAAFACGLLSKENAAVVPGLIVWGWVVGLGRPTRRRIAVYAATWVLLGAVYVATRTAVLHPFAHIKNMAAVFVGASPLDVRLTAIAEMTDFARLLVFPLTLRVDYSPAERTLVTSVSDGRFLVGVGCLAVWVLLIVLAWRRGRTVEAFGLGWIAIALSPVANLVFPAGVLLAERTLYLPSAGLALAAGACLPRVAPRRWPMVVGLLVVAGGIRSALRVPVWRDDHSVVLSEFEDSPRSFDGPARMVGLYLNAHQPAKAVAAFRLAESIYDRLPWLYMWGADAALSAGNPGLADSSLERLERLCNRCDYYYRFEANAARSRGDTAVASAIMARLPRDVP
jgi:protein O-mannosyl-transferase